VIRFRQLSRAYGAGGVSWWDWQESPTRDWKALGRPAPNLHGFQATAVLPTLAARGGHGISAGDLVVWAQQYLYSAGWHVQIDGDFRSRTRTAVKQFQAAHGLTPSGVIDTPTWQALQRYPAAPVIWRARNGRTVASGARAGLYLPPPLSARLPARRYEIPPHLGAGSSTRR
jgi:peptidoglycan hydrolase-like protein with peptidoglycan-binding domain